MMRSPLFYPMHRGDTDAGGAADLQTDIMRFMAILALCLVAIFALVQSIPLIPDAPATSEAKAAPPQPAETVIPADPPAVADMKAKPAVRTASPPATTETLAAVELTRPKWVTNFRPRDVPEIVEPAPAESAPAAAEPASATQEAPTEEGFSLRFESDLALTRLVASGQVGLYALAEGRARRMTVSDSRISFWDASTPNEYHEMEAATVPGPVVDALARTGADTASVAWGVTLPGRLRTQLDTLMHEYRGGALVIGSDGSLRREPS